MPLNCLLVARPAARVTHFDDNVPRQFVLDADRKLIDLRDHKFRVGEMDVAAEKCQRAERATRGLLHAQREGIVQVVERRPVSVVRRDERRLNAKPVFPSGSVGLRK